MRAANAKVSFGEWLPDLPPLDNPGLTEALNVVPTAGVYKPYLPILGTGDALGARPQGGASAFDTTGAAFFYCGTDDSLFVRAGTGWTDKSGATYTTPSTGYWRFAQFDSTLIATNYADVPQSIEVGSGSDFADLAATGTAPKARQIGVVGRFVVLGDTDDATNGAVPSRLQWPAIDDPTDWETPGTAAALAVQAGEQFMNSNYGPVRSIVSGEQYGIVLQRGAITRMTYIGGDIVFQFDTIERNRGALFPNATVQIGKLVYFVSGDGFYVTDGVVVVPIGERKADNYFADNIDMTYPERMYGAIDFANKCIVWAYPGPSNTDGEPNSLLIYNYEEKRWTHAEDDCEVIVTGTTVAISLDDLDELFSSIDIVTPSLDSGQWAGGNDLVLGFDADYKLGAFSGTAGTAVIESQEIEPNPGGRTFVAGIKPHVLGSPDTVSVALGTRDNLSDSPSYTSDVEPTTRTGFADFRNDSKYLRARVTIDGSFDSAVGFEGQYTASGAA